MSLRHVIPKLQRTSRQARSLISLLISSSNNRPPAATVCPGQRSFCLDAAGQRALLAPRARQHSETVLRAASMSALFSTAEVGAIHSVPKRSLDDIVSAHRKDAMWRAMQVAEISPGGKIVDREKTVSVAELGIPPRDAGLFTSDNSHATNQRAAIMVRNGRILFKTEAVRAVISDTQAMIIRNKAGKSFDTTLKIVQEAIVGEEDLVPFELNVLEALLFLTSSYFDARIGHLNFMYDGVVSDVREGSEPFSAVASEAMVQQLTPLDKAITAVRNDARETREAIADILNDEDMLQSLCLSQLRAAPSLPLCPPGTCEPRPTYSQHAPHPTPSHPEDPTPAKRTVPGQQHVACQPQQARHTPDEQIRCPLGLQPVASQSEESDLEQLRRMLATYEREMNSVMGQLEEMRENLDGTREAFGMRMDAARNEIILVNLKMTLASISLMICVIVPTMLGMNISHNLPDQPWVFYSICGVSVFVAVLSYPLASYLFQQSWRTRSASEFARFTALRLFLMQHLDDLDDIRASLDSIRGQVDRKQFKQHLRSSLPGTKFSAGALDCLFDQYDVDRDGLVREVEINQRNARQDVTTITSGMPDEIKRDVNLMSYPLESTEAASWMWRPKPKHRENVPL